MQKNFHRAAGFTLLEVSLGLIITGIVIGGLWIVLSDITQSHAVNQAEKGIITTVARIRNFYRDRQLQNDHALLDNADLISFDLVSPEILTKAGIAHDLSAKGLAGTITISYTPASCPVLNSITMKIQNIRKSACNQIVPELAGTRGAIQGNGINGLSVAGTSVLQSTVMNNVTIYDLDPALVQANCADNVTVILCFAQF